MMCSDFIYQSSSEYKIVHNTRWSFKRTRIYMARCSYAWNTCLSWSTAKYEQSGSVWHWRVFECKQHNNRIVSRDHKTHNRNSEVITFWIGRRYLITLSLMSLQICRTDENQIESISKSTDASSWSCEFLDRKRNIQSWNKTFIVDQFWVELFPDLYAWCHWIVFVYFFCIFVHD